MPRLGSQVHASFPLTKEVFVSLSNLLVSRFLHFASCTAEAQAKFFDNTDGFPLLAPRPAACVIMILFCSFVK